MSSSLSRAREVGTIFVYVFGEKRGWLVVVFYLQFLFPGPQAYDTIIGLNYAEFLSRQILHKTQLLRLQSWIEKGKLPLKGRHLYYLFNSVLSVF